MLSMAPIADAVLAEISLSVAIIDVAVPSKTAIKSKGTIQFRPLPTLASPEIANASLVRRPGEET